MSFHLITKPNERDSIKKYKDFGSQHNKIL